MKKKMILIKKSLTSTNRDTACDLLMMEEGLDFRATKDIDLVLIIEAVDAAFGRRFWEYIHAAGYEHRKKSTAKPQFYRFTNPRSPEYPAMMELFTRRSDTVLLPENALLSPLPIDEDVSSLSAILLDDNMKKILLEEVDLKQLGIFNRTKEAIVEELRLLYG